MKYVIGCAASAMLGSMMTFWLLDASHQANAQPPQNGSAVHTTAGPNFPTEVNLPAPSAPEPDSGNTPSELTSEEEVAVRVYRETNRSVVNITTKTVRSDVFLLSESISKGNGSGCVVDREGHILTNYHVVEEARNVSVTLYNGKSYEAKLVGRDSLNDLAVLKIDAPADVLHPLSVGDSSQLRVGMRVFAIGNPFGLERTMTTGIISSLNRSLPSRANRSIRSIIQIDAAVNPGNSGGPLLDSQGRLIGINMAIATKTGQSSGVGFAIPANLVTRVVRELIKHGRFIRPESGIRRVYETEKGLLIAALTAKGPAAKAGLKGPVHERKRRGPFLVERTDWSQADLIIAVDGKPTMTADDFLNQIETRAAGEKVMLTVIRNSRQLKIPLVLERGE